MAENGRALFRHLLASGYDELKRRLTRRFGSADMATEVLHETWIRIGQMTESAAIQSPSSYLYRMALNIAVDRQRAEIRWSGRAELEVLLRADDDQLDLDHIVSIRSQMAELERILAELPSRRRNIFVAALVEDLSYREIADRFGISLRSVEREMSFAFDHCSKRIEKFPARRRVGASRNVLSDEAMQKRSLDDTHDD
jgi:RNA polymerase sigma-70 factor, ECF subfamily